MKPENLSMICIIYSIIILLTIFNTSNAEEAGEAPTFTPEEAENAPDTPDPVTGELPDNFPLLEDKGIENDTAISNSEDQVFVETDPEVVSLQKEVEEACKNGDWRKVLKGLFTLTEKHPKCLGHIDLENNILAPLSVYFPLKIASLDPEGIRAYRDLNDGVAKEIFEGAKNASNWDALKELVERYFSTSVGEQAGDVLAEHLFERGQIVAAAALWKQLLENYPQPEQSRPNILVKLAMAYHQLQRHDRVAEINKEISDRFQAETVTFSGASMPALLFLQKNLQQERGSSEGPRVDSQVTESGNFWKDTKVENVYEAGLERWSHFLGQPRLPDDGGNEFKEIKSLEFSNHYYPYASGGFVYLNDDTRVVGLDWKSGKSVWESVVGEAGVAGADQPRDNEFSPAISGDILCVKIGGSLRAFDRVTGRRLWDTRDTFGEGAQENFFSDLMHFTSPVPAAGLFVIGCSRLKGEMESLAAAFDIHTGKLVWQTVNAARGKEAFLGLGSRPSLPVFKDGIVYFGTNLGAVAALDAATGSPRWIRKYDAFLPGMRKRSIRDSRRWRYQPPRVVGGILYATPQDSNYLYAIDVVDGSLLWRLPRREKDALLAWNSKLLFLGGKTLCGVDRMTGRVVWESDRISGPLAGVGAASETDLLVAGGQGLWRVDAQNGQPASLFRWNSGEQPGDILLIQDHLLLCGPGWIRCLESRESAAKRTEPQDSDEEAVALTRKKLADLARRYGDWSDAIRWSQEAVEKLRAGEPEEDRAEEIRKVEKILEGALVSRGKENRTLGDFGAAALDFRAAARVASRPIDAIEGWRQAGECLEALKDWKAALSAYQELLERHGSDSYEFEPGVQIPVRTFAREAIEGIVAAAGPDVYGEVEKKAEALAFEAEQASSITLWRRVFERYPNSQKAVEAFYQCARLCLEEKEYASAVSSLEELLRTRPGSSREVEAMVLLARAYEARGDLAWARGLYQYLRDAHGKKAINMEGGGAVEVSEVAQAALDRLSAAGGVADQAAGALDFPLRLKWQTYSKILSGTSAFLSVEGSPPPALTDLFFVISRTLVGRPPGLFDLLECHSKTTGTEIWVRRIPAGLARTGCAGYAGDLLVLKSASQLIALRIATGQPAWVFSRGEMVAPALPFGDDISTPRPQSLLDELRQAEDPGMQVEAHRWSGLAFAEGRIYAVTVGRKVFCLDAADGNKLWEREVEESLVGPPILASDGKVILCTENPIKIYELDGTDGSLLFSREFPAPDSRLPLTPVLARNKKILYFLGGDRSLQAFDLEARDFLWKKEAGMPGLQLKISSSGKFLILSPSQWSRSGPLTVLDTENGNKVWSLDIDDLKVRATVLSGEDIYLIYSKDMDVILAAYELSSGNKHWEVPVPRVWGQAMLAVSGKAVAVAIERMPKAYLYRRDSGLLVDELNFPGRSQLAMELLGDTLCFATDRGLFAYAYLKEEFLRERCIELARHLKEQPQEESYLLELATLHLQLGQPRQALDLLCRALNSETLAEITFRRLSDQLAAIQEFQAAQGSPGLELRKFSSPPDIDGDLSDAWRERQAIPLGSPEYISRIQDGGERLRFWRGRSDLSGTLYMGWDDKNLYIAVDVVDDVPQSFSSDSPTWKGDGLMIAIDPDNDGGFGYDGRDYVFTQALMNKPPNDNNEDGEPEGQYAVRHKPDGTGTVYESAIPWTYINRVDPRAGSSFGFNIFVTDDDTGRGSEKGMTWTSGFQLHRFRDFFSKGYVPQYFGKVHLKD